MIFYLDIGDKFLLEFIDTDLVFILKSSVTEKVLISSVRWKELPIFFSDRNHIEDILKLLKSDNQADRNIGKEILSQTLKVKIHGEIIGHKE